MHSDSDQEFIAYRQEEYRHKDADVSRLEAEDEFAYEKTLPHFKWNEFGMLDYNSLSTSDISFKRVKRDDEDEPPPPPPPPPDDAPGDSPGGDGGDGGGDAPEAARPEPKTFYTPIIGITVFFAIVMIIGPFFVRKGPNRGIVQCSIMIAAFCMWIFWVTVYIGQMNPLMGPRLENTTIAWIAYKLGNPVKPAEPAPE